MVWLDCTNIEIHNNKGCALLDLDFSPFYFKYYFDKKKRRRRGFFRTTVDRVNKALEQEIMLRRMA